MADLDFVSVVGRLGLVVADGPVDPDNNPDITWCNEGQVWFTPLNTRTKVVGATPVPAMMGQSVIVATIDSEGYISRSGVRSITLVDLTSTKVNPYIPAGKATHRVEFRGVQADGTAVTFDAFNARFANDTLGQTGAVDLTLAAPVPAAGGTPIVVGPQGVSVTSLRVEAGELIYTLSNGDEDFAGALPVGPGGTDAGVASYLRNSASKTSGELATQLQLKVGPLVSSAIAAEDQVVTAAAEAVGEVLDDVGILHDVYNVDALSPEEEIAFVITDEDGRRSWLEVGVDGAPTGRVLRLISESINGLPTHVDALGPAYVITDSEDRTAFLVQSDGSVDVPKFGETTQTRLIERVVEAIPYSNAIQYVDGEGSVYPIASGPDYCHAGDSLTAFGGVAERLAQLTGQTHRVAAVGGENSYGIAARLNALPYLMSPAGGVIPASGSVDVVFTTMLPGTSWPLLQGDGGGSTGTVAGVPVTLSMKTKDPNVGYPSHGPNDVYQLTRIGTGAPVTINKPTPFLYDFGNDRRKDVMIVWHGQNGIGSSWTGPSSETGDSQFIGDVIGVSRAIVENMQAAEKRYLFMSRPGVESVGWTDEERAFSREFGRRFCNVRRYLIDYALTDLGITPTTQDVADKNAGRIPSSLRIDAVHHTTAAQHAIAEFLIYPRLRDLGWIKP